MKKNKFNAILPLFIAILVGGISSVIQISSARGLENKLDIIPGQYIIVFNDKVKDANFESESISRAVKLEKIHTYNHAIKGFSARMSDIDLEKIKNDPRVDFVAEDRAVYVSDSASDSDEDNVSEKASSFRSSGEFTTQVGPPQIIPTGVNRINAESLLNKGTRVGVAVIDTGIELTHPDLKRNIIANKSCVLGVENGNDDHGHGTHVAGTIAASNNKIGVVGVAPKAKLLAVKVIGSGGSGTWSAVICGVDWVTANVSKYNIKVANMSLTGTGSSDNNCGYTNNDPVHRAICKSRDAGVTYVVAAGNSSYPVSFYIPASYDDAVITVSALVDTDGISGGLGSTTSYGADDTFATFSNYGSTTVDFGAPGVGIYSTFKGGGYGTLRGTSMAAPHVSGAVALYLKKHPSATWIQVRKGLKALAENIGFGHTDTSGLHPEPVIRADSL